MVLAVVTVAEGGAGHVPVRSGHAGETGRAGEEHSTGVQRPHCRDRVQLCHPSLPSVCPPCHQPRTHPEPRGAGRGPCPPPAPAGHWQSPARPRGARPAPAPAAAPPPTAHRSAAPRCPPCGDTTPRVCGCRTPGPALHPGTAVAPQRGTVPVPPCRGVSHTAGLGHHPPDPCHLQPQEPRHRREEGSDLRRVVGAEHDGPQPAPLGPIPHSPSR